MEGSLFCPTSKRHAPFEQDGLYDKSRIKAEVCACLLKEIRFDLRVIAWIL
jgi:hypothetical protein